MSNYGDTLRRYQNGRKKRLKTPSSKTSATIWHSYYPKIIVVLCIKNVRFCTPRSCVLNPFNFEFRDSA